MLPPAMLRMSKLRIWRNHLFLHHILDADVAVQVSPCFLFPLPLHTSFL